MGNGESLVFRNVTLEDAAVIMRQAAAWLEQRGEPLWAPADLIAENLVRRCQPDEIFAGHLAAVPVVCALIQHRDFLWPDDDAAFIVHKLAVLRAHAGRGFALQMLTFAGDLARANGRKFLRLDCADRPKLRAFYEHAGFTLAGLKTIGHMGVALYEKAL